ncbi:unnamed protein product [Acanthoscelides obtectus]|uniref:Protein regulator of cytokinesis 1 n=1 Tax=Acanthoscelides obtectus TaxID=200917 RepID=A0A9P0K6T3_ACAOB|nr:unnamed protein product [Acanthoscelides obtectus]CAK1622704.1 Protein regulator of cytokinesis 1 [Acanthoscelides obtectus]
MTNLLTCLDVFSFHGWFPRNLCLSSNKLLEDAYKTLQERLKKGYLNYAQIILDVTDDRREIRKYLKIFEDTSDDTYMDLIKDISELRDKCYVKFEESLKKIEEICKSLQMQIPSFGMNQLCMRQKYLQLEKQLKDYEQMYNTRIEEINTLREKQLDLCKSLGIEPKIIKESPLPSAAEIAELKVYLEDLENERFTRQEKFVQSKETILKIVEELNYKPSSKFEHQIILGGDFCDFCVTVNNMKKLEHLHEQLAVQLINVKEEIAESWTKLKEMWDMLDIELLEQHKFKEAHQGNSLDVLEALRVEIGRCNELKKANIEKFITLLRQQIQEMWQKCHVTEEEGTSQFHFFDTNHYTETALELFEKELQKWKDYFEENKEIIQLLNRHSKLWSKFMGLQEHADAGRLKNRGGQLLKEERERNQLTKSIPKVECQLQSLCDKFEEIHQKPFKTFGQTVTDYLENAHQDFENMRKAKLNGRKTPGSAVSASGTPLRSMTNLTPTPSKIMSAAKRKLQAPAALIASTKKTKVSPTSIKKHKVAVPKITVTVHIGKRNSMELKKIEKKRRSHTLQKKLLKAPGADDDEYVDFVNEISDRAARSTTFTIQEEQPCSAKKTTNLGHTPKKKTVASRINS